MQFFADTPILTAAYRHVLQLLQPVKHYAYHNIGHTLDVFRRSRQLAEQEWISKTEQVPLLLAALFHDTGFIESYSKNEVIGMRLARDWLTTQNYPESSICEVERLIEVTIPFTPAQTILEKIIQDADLDNFGRDDCFSKMYRVEEELKEMTSLDTRTMYDIFRSLHAYNFQTSTAQRDRQPKRLSNREKFENLYATKFASQ
jgi:HD superfamily phosphodiesterase